MKVRHVTFDTAYRYPTGAAIQGSRVTLAIDTWEGMARACDLRLWQEGIGETIVPMTAVDPAPAPDGSNSPCRRFSVDIAPDTLGVLWYSFRIVACDGRTVWLGAPEGWSTGEGALYDHEPPSFQMTVYVPRAGESDGQQPKLAEDGKADGAWPRWYTEGIVYQIFPDRFARGADWPTRAQAALETPRRGPARRLVDDWDTPPTYDRESNGDIATWDFYGGSFAGIRERLGYLQDLGATVLYLNPIFEAASSHRYDTADYLAVDSMLGTLDDFRALCDDARAHGMRIILDGVFNHSGQDSRYFNAYGNYPDRGASQGADSPYRSWYHFHEDGTYESWWGVRDLPEYDENDPDLREFFCGENGVVRTWLRAGASGWRLDVADELPDSFIEDIRAAALAEKPDAVIIGEVWEDASNKYAYGQLRHYFQGAELDGVMNYPFRTTVIDFLTGAIHAPEAAARLRQLAENYPAPALACCLNLLGSHDRERIFTMLGGAPRADELDEAGRASYRLTPDQRELARNRTKLATTLQMTAPGVPSVYYGDETGLEGYRDPYNRATMPWEHLDRGLLGLYRDAIALRRSLPVLVEGTFEPISFGNEVLGWWRRGTAPASTTPDGCATTHPADPSTRTSLFAKVSADAKGAGAGTGTTQQAPSNAEAVCVLVNRSPWDWVTVSVPAEGPCVSELGRAQAARIENGQVTVTLKPFERSILYFHPTQRLQAPMPAGRGLIAHVTSVPNATGPGTLGAPARAFADWLAEHGYTYWQMLPVNPTDACGSPYAGLSAFAGNPALLASGTDIDAFAVQHSADYQAFCEKNAAWLEPYAAFRAIKGLVGETPWQEWPEQYRHWNPSPESAVHSPLSPGEDPSIAKSALDALPAAEGSALAGGMNATFPPPDDAAQLAAIAEQVRREQFAFQAQWDELRAYANARGVKIIGDLPIYVSADSADVWSRPELFDLDEAGHPAGIAGVPPDNLAADGQIWNNPTYRWDRMADDDYAWWMARLERMFALYDYVRLDHFLGFSSYYLIRAGQSATEGVWKYGPGRAFFEKACARFGGPLPLIGENLGTITPAVRTLVASCGFPGMDVIQFADNDPRAWYAPAPETLIYLSTHDTQTLVGWCEGRYGLDRAAAVDLAKRLISRTRDEHPDDVVMMQLQDALLLGDEARMNVPGVADGNWTWQARADQLAQEIA